MTHNKKRIHDVFTQHHVLSVQDLHKKLPDIDLSTLYRNVQRFVDDGVLREVTVMPQITSYEIIGDSHDHFVCTSCHDVQALHIESGVVRRFLPTGSTVTDGEIVIHGMCRQCNYS